MFVKHCFRIIAPKDIINNQAFNVEIEGGNYTVKEIALASQNIIKGSNLIFTNKFSNDERTYKVSFKKINTVLKDYFKPKWNLESGGIDILNFLKKNNINEEIFRGPKTNKLNN